MITGFLIVVFTISVVIGTVIAMLMLIGSSVYDLISFYEKQKAQKLSKNKRRQYRPLVSVVIPAFNEELTIEHCLRELKKVSYRNLEIIVSDDVSKDRTREVVRNYIKQNPKQNIRLVNKRKNGGRGAAINLGVKHARGELIMALDADCTLERTSVTKMVWHFADPSVSAVAANVRIKDDGTVLGLLQRLEYLVSFRSKKFNSLTNSEFIIGGAGASYRKSVLESVGGFDDRMKTEDIELSMRMTRLLGKTGGLIYASDFLVHTEPVPTYKALFRQRFRWKFGSLQALYHNRALIFSAQKKQNLFTTMVRIPFALWSEFMLLLEPILFTSFVYLAFVQGNPWLFIGAAAAYSVITWLAIWSDEHLNMRERLQLTSIAPFMYTASFVLSLVQVSAAFRSIRHGKTLVKTKGISGAYATTARRAVSGA